MPPKPINDQRADSTLDALTPQAEPAGASALDAIAQEERDENEAIAQAHEAQQQAEAAAEMDALVQGWQEAMRHAGDIITAAYDPLKPVWTPDRMDNLGAALARADAHYGWGGAGMLLGHPLVAVGVAALPVAIGTVQVMKLERAKAEALAAQKLESLGARPAGMVPAAPPGEQKHPGKEQPAARVPNMAHVMDGALARDTFQA